MLVDEAGGGGSAVDSYETTIGSPVDDADDNLLQLDDDATKTLISPPDSRSRQNSFDAASAASPPFDNTISSSESTSFSEDSAGSSPFDGQPNSPFDSRNSQSTPFGAPPVQQQQPYNQDSFDQTRNQFGQPLQQASWSPPPAPESGWQSQNIGANTPFQPPMTAHGSDNTLPVISLVCGILSLTCCGPITGIVALITGFIGKNNADSNPQQYGGRGLALAGMIMGGISLVVTVLYILFVLIAGFGGIR